MGLKLRQSPGNNWPEGEGKGKEEPGEQKGASKLALSWLKLYLWHRLFSLNKQASDPSTRWEAVRGRHTLNFPLPAWLGWSQKEKVTAAPGNHEQEEVKHRRMFKRPRVPWHSARASLPHPQPGAGGKGPEHHYRQDDMRGTLHETDLTSGMLTVSTESKTAPQVCFPRVEKSTWFLPAAQGDRRTLSDSRKQGLSGN